DSIYRYGGDEFVVLLSRADCDQAQNIAQRIIELIHEGRVDGLAETPGISIGIASHSLTEMCDKQALLSAADTALYRAKDAGKNRICIYQQQENSTARVQQSRSCDMHRRTVIKGLALVAGIGIGYSYRYRDVLSRETAIFDITPSQVSSEMDRVRNALKKAHRYIRRIQKAIDHFPENTTQDIDPLIIEPQTILEEIEDELSRKLINAEQIVRAVFHQIERRFRNCGNSVVREHAPEVSEVGNRILRMLTGTQENPLAQMPADTVIFSRRLMPADTVHFENSPPAAIITQDGGIGSHSATVSRALEIPSVCRLPLTIDDLPQRVPVIVDGYKGLVVFNPTEEEKEEYRLQRDGLRSRLRNTRARSGGRPLSIDGTPVRVHATATCSRDIQTAIERGADDIGLYKVEPLFMRSAMLPSEGELFKTLYQSLLTAAHKEITLQLPDLGGDHSPAYIQHPHQSNPALGLRGIRFLIRYPIILETMLRVCIRLSAHFNIRILVPMVTFPEELETIRRKLKQEMGLLEKEKVQFNEAIAVGANIQTPAAIITLDQIIHHADFLSIDSDDLIQYTMVADRENVQMADYYEKGGTMSLNLIHAAMQKAKNERMDCTLCGRLAGDIRYTDCLLTSGFREFCVLPPFVAELKDQIFHLIDG
ncbi:MAG: putative PEP-binding protein, partial [Chitinivibrionales bacterium]